MIERNRKELEVKGNGRKVREGRYMGRVEFAHLDEILDTPPVMSSLISRFTSLSDVCEQAIYLNSNSCA